MVGILLQGQASKALCDKTEKASNAPLGCSGLGANKFDEAKPRYDLIPPEALDQLALLYARGAVKYGEGNWLKGMTWGRYFAAGMRHGWAWWRGERVDPETGIHHCIAAAWNFIACFTYEERGLGQDTRPLVAGMAPAASVAAPKAQPQREPEWRVWLERSVLLAWGLCGVLWTITGVTWLVKWLWPEWQG